MSFLRFLLLFTGISLILAFIFLTIEESDSKDSVLVPDFWLIFGFQYFITVIAYSASVFGLRKGPEISTLVIMGALAVKMLFCMAFVLAYLLKISVNGVSFAVQFFSVYFLFTAFEVYALLRNLRHQNKT
ncbi:hypothetical protein [Pedobacter sp. SYSU D00535]|uniref:hypothetical protein n=1 Tax=Pedobacter sp. SYSU D00535 TaxID=2810308 RepID=UPI001A969B82|nr:hypothetical protein [Pedobacter sp. SYSU D00535]